MEEKVDERKEERKGVNDDGIEKNELKVQRKGNERKIGKMGDMKGKRTERERRGWMRGKLK